MWTILNPHYRPQQGVHPLQAFVMPWKGILTDKGLHPYSEPGVRWDAGIMIDTTTPLFVSEEEALKGLEEEIGKQASVTKGLFMDLRRSMTLRMGEIGLIEGLDDSYDVHHFIIEASFVKEDATEKRWANYARWWFFNYEMPSYMQVAFHEFMEKHPLFCTYEGERYRVTGCSRLGDVWLHSDPTRDHGYEKRVAVRSCSAWSNKL